MNENFKWRVVTPAGLHHSPVHKPAPFLSHPFHGDRTDSAPKHQNLQPNKDIKYRYQENLYIRHIWNNNVLECTANYLLSAASDSQNIIFFYLKKKLTVTSLHSNLVISKMFLICIKNLVLWIYTLLLWSSKVVVHGCTIYLDTSTLQN